MATLVVAVAAAWIGANALLVGTWSLAVRARRRAALHRAFLERQDRRRAPAVVLTLVEREVGRRGRPTMT